MSGTLFPPLLELPFPSHITKHQLPNMPEPCLEWIGNKDEDGYGRIKVKGVEIKTHRLFYQLFVDPQPLSSTSVVMHKCDNPPCINPLHLKKGTHAENIADCMKKGRHVRGAATGSAKLNDEMVAELRRRYENGASSPVLAKEVGLSTSTMQNVLYGRTWAHVPNPCKPRPLGTRTKERK